MRRLVVNADDLGLTTAVNDGIFDAHQHGILTSASLFANAPATADAIRRARSHPALGIGIHLALVDGVPALSPTLVPSLIADAGRLRPSWKPFIVACLAGRVSLVEVERELTAQITRVLDAGITPTHVDAHKHVHGYPPIFAVVARLAARFGIPVVRVPQERWSSHSAFGDRQHHSWIVRTQAWLNAAMGPWSQRNRQTAASLGLRVPSFIGRIHTGVLDGPTLRALIIGIDSGVTELMVHPGYVDDELAASGTRLLASREEELTLLCRVDTRALVATERIELARHDLAPIARRSLRHVS